MIKASQYTRRVKSFSSKTRCAAQDLEITQRSLDPETEVEWPTHRGSTSNRKVGRARGQAT
jgi:hypothetical protein